MNRPPEQFVATGLTGRLVKAKSKVYADHEIYDELKLYLHWNRFTSPFSTARLKETVSCLTIFLPMLEETVLHNRLLDIIDAADDLVLIDNTVFLRSETS
ncbi:MAG: hypothetical protein AAF497_28995 [Planctomycetota bacterium]